MTPPRRTYWDYLQLPQVLGAQRPATDAHDEMAFIVVHQAYELWFKLTLHEMTCVQAILASRDVSPLALVRVHHYMCRANAIWSLMVQQIQIIETIRPIDFLGFRDQLTPASGFQSLQMRMIETLAGLTDDQRTASGAQTYKTAAGFPAQMLAQIDDVESKGSLRALLMPYLAELPVPAEQRAWVVARALDHGMLRDRRLSEVVSDGDSARERATARRDASASENATSDARTKTEERRAREATLRMNLDQSGFQVALAVYTWPEQFAAAYQICEDFIEFEERFISWRVHHARTVERFIGKKIGTGGSTGVPYLEHTTRYRIFEELWSVRTLLVHPGARSDASQAVHQRDPGEHDA